MSLNLAHSFPATHIRLNFDSRNWLYCALSTSPIRLNTGHSSWTICQHRCTFERKPMHQQSSSGGTSSAWLWFCMLQIFVWLTHYWMESWCCLASMRWSKFCQMAFRFVNSHPMFLQKLPPWLIGELPTKWCECSREARMNNFGIPHSWFWLSFKGWD